MGILLAGMIAVAHAQASGAVALIPAPQQLTYKPGRLELSLATPLVLVAESAAAAEVTDLLAEWLAEHPGFSARRVRERLPAATNVHLRLGTGDAPQVPESYRLRVTADGIEIGARDIRGLRYGAVTLWQLIASRVTSTDVSLPCLEIIDAPRFPWRGLLLDSARHYQPPAFIERFIDWMALHKLNVLHWHLTDDQAWRLEIRRYPRLTEVGAWRVPAGAAAQQDVDRATGAPRRYGGYYSQETVRRLVRYAAARNVTIVPEIEMPGHATAAIVAYPQLGAGRSPDVVPADWGIYPNLFNIEEATFAFLQDVLSEVLELFPSVYIHAGGDEVAKEQWRSSARVQQLMRERGISDERALQSDFVRRIGRFLAAHGRRLVGWDEILEGGLAPEATVMSWRGVDGARTAAIAGHDTVLAPWPTLYFDHRQGTGVEEPPGRGRVVSLEEVYRFEPTIAGLTPQQHRHVLGLQGNIWTEHIRTKERVEWMTIPRAAAVAELGWSPVERLDFADFRTRLIVAVEWYRALGYHFATTALQASQPAATHRRRSQELETCTDRLVLNLEDDAPLEGRRAVFLIDIMNPCWIFRDADLTDVEAILVAVGQLPFNFQLGEERESIRLRAPRGPYGELEVRLDDCSGTLLASLSLEPAQVYTGVTTLPAATLEPRAGRHDLCLSFTGHAIEPLWAIDSIELVPGH